MNHPVHIVDAHKNQSPSAFIPFCSFGSNLTDAGIHVPGFSIPVCRLFKPSLHNGQMCYKLDLSNIKDDVKISSGIKGGLTFFMDYNEDRMLNNIEKMLELKESEASSIDFSAVESTEPQASIYIDTLGKVMNIIVKGSFFAIVNDS